MVNRSRKAMVNLLKDPHNCGERKSCGRLQLTALARAVIRVALNSSSIARQIEKAGVAINVGNVRRLLMNCEHLKRRKLREKQAVCAVWNLQRDAFK